MALETSVEPQGATQEPIKAAPEPLIKARLKTVGCDDGYAAIKIAHFMRRPGEALSIKTHVVPSKIQIGSHAASDFRGRRSGVYLVDQETYSVNASLDGENTRFADYPVSNLNRVLVHHALIEAGLGGLALHLVTGLPPGDYFRATGLNDDLIKRKRENLFKPISALDSAVNFAQIVDHSVFSEAVAAVVDFLLDDAGNEVNKISGPMAVVDIGGRTTDVVVVLEDLRIDHQRSGTDNIGVLKLLDEVRERIRAHTGLGNDELNGIDMERVLRSRVCRLFGKDHDVGQLIDEAIHEVSGSIQRIVQSRVGKGANLDRVLFVGGGAAVMQDVIRTYQNAVVAPDPQFANARGMLKSEFV